MVTAVLEAFRKHWRPIAAVSVLVVSLLLIAIPESRAPVVAMDEGSLLEYPTLVRAGEMPHRDFETMYGPANLWVLSLAYRFFGTSIFVERAVGFLYEVAIGLAMILLARRKGWAIAASAGVLSAGLATFSGLYAYAWWGALALALFSIYLSTQTSHKLLGGFLGGLALGFRPDFALAIGGVALVLRNWTYVKGVLIGLLPLLAHVLLIGPAVAFQRMFVVPVFHSAGRRLPPPWHFSLFWLIAGSFVFIVGATLLMPRDHRRPLLVLTVFAVGLLPQAMQRPDQSHLLEAGCVWVGLVPLYAASLPSIEANPRSAAFAQVSALGLATLLLLSSFANLGLHPYPSTELTHEGRTVYLDFVGDQAPLNELIARVDELSHPGQRLFVGPRDLSRTFLNDTFLYFMFPELHPATYFLEMNPGSANRPGTRLASDVASADFVILSSKWSGVNEPNSSREAGDPAANRVVQTDFCEDATFGNWELLTRCSGE